MRSKAGHFRADSQPPARWYHLLLLLVHGGDDDDCKKVFEQSLLEEVHRERGWGEGASRRERVHIPCILMISGMEHYENHKPFTFCQLSMYKFSWINCKQKQIWRTNCLFKTNSITKQSKTGAIISKFQRWIDLDQVSFSYASVKLPFYDLFDANSEILYPITILFYNSVMLKLE